jgi:HEPN domain-containing protein
MVLRASRHQSDEQSSARDPMISEAKGATPFGIFMLAEAFLRAAHDTFGHSIKITEGPTRLLCYHACELYLKAYLRERGEDVEALRAYGHDLKKMHDRAIKKGLKSTSQTVAQLRKASINNDYVRVRYMVIEERLDRDAEKVLNLAADVRRSVATSSDDAGIRDHFDRSGDTNRY